MCWRCAGFSRELFASCVTYFRQFSINTIFAFWKSIFDQKERKKLTENSKIPLCDMLFTFPPPLSWNHGVLQMIRKTRSPERKKERTNYLTLCNVKTRKQKLKINLILEPKKNKQTKWKFWNEIFFQCSARVLFFLFPSFVCDFFPVCREASKK